MLSEFFDTKSVRDDPASWDRLAQRVAEQATRESRRDAIQWLSQLRAGWIAASLVAFGLLAAMLAASQESARLRDRAADWEGFLAPADDIGRTMTTADRPPPIGALVLGTRKGS